MKTQEILTDLVSNRGAVLELSGDIAAPQSVLPLTLLGAAEPIDATRLFYFPADPQVLTGKVLPFASMKRLHALAVGFYDAHGELIARLAQIRECDLDAPHEAQLTAQFAAWQKLLADKLTGPKLAGLIQTALTGIATTPVPATTDSGRGTQD